MSEKKYSYKNKKSVPLKISAKINNSSVGGHNGYYSFKDLYKKSRVYDPYFAGDAREDAYLSSLLRTEICGRGGGNPA